MPSRLVPPAPPSAVPPKKPVAGPKYPSKGSESDAERMGTIPTNRPKIPIPVERGESDAAVEDGPLDLLDGLGDLDVAGAGVRAVERRPAPEHARALVEDLEPFAGGLVARVEDEAVGVDDRGGTDVGLVAPVDRARRGARGAQDAFGGVVETGTVLGALEPFGVAGVIGVDE